MTGLPNLRGSHIWINEKQVSMTRTGTPFISSPTHGTKGKRYVVQLQGIFSICLATKAWTQHLLLTTKISGISGIPKTIFEILATPKIFLFCTLTLRKDPRIQITKNTNIIYSRKSNILTLAMYSY